VAGVPRYSTTPAVVDYARRFATLLSRSEGCLRLNYDFIMTSTAAPSKSNIVVVPCHVRVRMCAIIFHEPCHRGQRSTAIYDTREIASRPV
jgi:hypothetical protein